MATTTREANKTSLMARRATESVRRYWDKVLSSSSLADESRAAKAMSFYLERVQDSLETISGLFDNISPAEQAEIRKIIVAPIIAAGITIYVDNLMFKAERVEIYYTGEAA